MSARLGPRIVLALALLGAGPAWTMSAVAQEAFVLQPNDRGLRLELDDIGAEDALRQLAGEYEFEVVWRVRTPSLRVTGWREGDAAQIAAWILRGYDYAMTTRGAGAERRPLRIVVFGERNATAAAPAPAIPDPNAMPTQSYDPNLPNYDPNAIPQGYDPNQPGYDPNVAPGDTSDQPFDPNAGYPPAQVPGSDQPSAAPYDPPPQDLPPEDLPP